MSDRQVVEIPQADELRREALSLRASEIRVVNKETYDQAAGFLRSVSRVRARIEELFEPAVRKAHEAHKAVLAAKGEILAPLAPAEKALRLAMQGWLAEVERERQAAEAKARAQARQAEEEEKARRAAELAEAGVEEEEIQQTVAAMPAPVAVSPAPQLTRVEGVAQRVEWRFEIVNEALVPREYLSIDEKKIRAVVKAFKGEKEIPGVRIFSEKVVAVRG